MTLDEILSKGTIIDVRSPSEYALDHIPTAINHPVLDDAQRELAGTLHKQESAFAARKLAAPMVAQAIASHIENHFSQHDISWSPLVYCWRGGQRSKSMETILRRIGWKAVRLEGGYKAYRRLVIASIQNLCKNLRVVIVMGRTGVGKSLLLQQLEASGQQVLNLEQLARHRGSVLGAIGNQPSQKAFESAICMKLRSFRYQQPTYIESESRKIGKVHIPDPLLQAMRNPESCQQLEASLQSRIQLIKHQYRHLSDSPQLFMESIQPLRKHTTKTTWQKWMYLYQTGDIDTFISTILQTHYDKLYTQSITKNFHSKISPTQLLDLGTQPITPATMVAQAKQITSIP